MALDLGTNRARLPRYAKALDLIGKNAVARQEM